MLKKILITFLIIPVIGGAIYGYYYFRTVKTPKTPVLKAIPENAFLVAQTHDFYARWKKTQSRNSMWEALLSVDAVTGFDKKLAYFDSLWQNARREWDLDRDQPLYFAAFPDTAKGIEFLFGFNVPMKVERQTVGKLVNGLFPRSEEIRKKLYNGVAVSTLRLNDATPLYYYQSKGLLVLTNNEQVIERSIDCLQTDRGLIRDPGFVSLLKTGDEKADANLLINFQNLGQVIPGFLNPDNVSLIQTLSGFGRWISLDMSMGSDQLLGNGFTLASDSLNDYLHLFYGQEPVVGHAEEILPDNTSRYISIRLSDPATFFKRKNNRDTGLARGIVTPQIKQHQQFLLQWFSEEAVCFYLEQDPAQQETPLVALRIRERSLTEDALRVFYPLDSNETGQQMHYRGMDFNKLNESGFLNSAFGSSFAIGGEVWSLLTNDYLILSKDPEALETWTNFYLSGRVLHKNKRYQQFTRNLSKSSNLGLYAAVARSGKMLEEQINPDLLPVLKKHQPLLKKFHSVAMQFNTNGKLFYNNFVLKYDPNYNSEKDALWQYTADALPEQDVRLLYNPSDSSQYYFIQDVNRVVYLLNEHGKELFKVAIEEPIVGIPELTDNNACGMALVFGTSKHLYVLNAKGEDCEGFPVVLENKLTAPVLVFPKTSGSESFILVAGTDLKMRAYGFDGEVMGDWRTDRLKDTLVEKPVLIKADGRTIVCWADRSGNVRTIDYKGDWIVKVKNPLEGFSGNILTIERHRSLAACAIWYKDSDGVLIRWTFEEKYKRMNLLDDLPGKNKNWLIGKDRQTDQTVIMGSIGRRFRCGTTKGKVFAEGLVEGVKTIEPIGWVSLEEDSSGKEESNTPAGLLLLRSEKHIHVFHCDGEPVELLRTEGKSAAGILNFNENGEQMLPVEDGKTIRSVRIKPVRRKIPI